VADSSTSANGLDTEDVVANGPTDATGEPDGAHTATVAEEVGVGVGAAVATDTGTADATDFQSLTVFMANAAAAEDTAR